MEIKDFKLIKNKQRPELCYKYELRKNGFKYEIFTMSAGEIFLASIEENDLENADKWWGVKSESFKAVTQCMEYFHKFNIEAYGSD